MRMKMRLEKILYINVEEGMHVDFQLVKSAHFFCQCLGIFNSTELARIELDILECNVRLLF